MIPSTEHIHRTLTAIMGPAGRADGKSRAEGRSQMRLLLEAQLPDFGISPGGDRYPSGAIDRRSVYAGPTSPTLYHRLNLAFYRDHHGLPPTLGRVQAYRQHVVSAESIYQDMEFCTVVVLREHHFGLGEDRSTMLSDTFSAGGLDHLGRDMQRMGFLPEDTRARWTDLGPETGCEDRAHTRCHPIQAASIPRRDQFLAYAATLRLNQERVKERVERVLPDTAESFMDMSVSQRRAWTQLAFARPNGHQYVARRGYRQLRNRGAGLVTVLGALAHHGETEGQPPHPRDIFEVPELSHMTSVRIARARAVEAQLLDDYGLLTVRPRPHVCVQLRGMHT